MIELIETNDRFKKMLTCLNWEKYFENSKILITGGTGSFGHAFVPMTLKNIIQRKLLYFLVMREAVGNGKTF